MTRLEAALAELAAAIRAEMAEAMAAEAGAPDRLLSVDEAAAALGIGRSLTYELMARGDLRSVKAGRRRLVPSSAIAELTRESARPEGNGRARKQARHAGADLHRSV